MALARLPGSMGHGLLGLAVLVLVLVELLGPLTLSTWAEEAPNPAEIRSEIEKVIANLGRRVIDYNTSLRVLRDIASCLRGKDDVLVLLSEALARDIENLSRNGPSKPLMIRILGNLDNIASILRDRFFGPPKHFEACKASDIYLFTLIAASNPTSIGLIVSNERLKKIGLLYGDPALQDTWLLSLVIHYTNQLDEDYWRLVENQLTTKGIRAVALYFSIVDAKYAPRRLAEKALSILANTTSPWNPHRVFQAALVYGIRHNTLREAALLSTARALYSQDLDLLAPLYSSLYLAEYNLVEGKAGSPLPTAKYTLQELVAMSLSLYPPGLRELRQEMPFTTIFLEACTPGSILTGVSIAGSNSTVKIQQPLLSSLYKSLLFSLLIRLAEGADPGKVSPDPLVLSISSLARGVTLSSVSVMNSSLRELLVDAFTEPRASGELLGIAGYYAVLEAHQRGLFNNFLRLTAFYPLVVIDPATLREGLRRAFLGGEDPLWLFEIREGVQPDKTVVAVIGLDLARLYSLLEPGQEPRDLLVEYYARTWSKYGSYVSIPLGPGDVSLIANTTGVADENTSLTLFWRIASGGIRPRSLEEAGWLARAASLRLLNGKLVLVVPLARLTASLLLDRMGLHDLARTALGLESAAGLNTTERWATVLLPSVVPPWLRLHVESGAAGNASSIGVNETTLLNELEELMNKTSGNKELSSLLSDYYDALARGDYQAALEAASRLRRYLEENYSRLSPELVEALARLSSINVTSRGLVIDVNQYSSLISDIVRAVNSTGGAIPVGTGEPGQEGTGKKDFIEGLVKAMQEHLVKNLGEKAAEIIRLHGGEELARLLESLEAKTPLRGIGSGAAGLGGIVSGILGSGPQAPVAPPLSLALPSGELGTPSGLLASPSYWALLALLSILVVVLVWAYRSGLIRRLVLSVEERRLRRLLAAPIATRESRMEVVRAFAGLLELYSRIFASREKSETHREYASKLPNQVREVYTEAAKAYEEAKFSSHPVGENHLEKVKRAIREALRVARRP